MRGLQAVPVGSQQYSPGSQPSPNTRDELQRIRIFQELGVHMMHLNYNRRNPIGDGAGETTDGGRSDFGHTVVAELNHLGIIADVSHSDWRTNLEAAKASKRPMVARRIITPLRLSD